MPLERAGRTVSYRYVPPPVYMGKRHGSPPSVSGRMIGGVCACSIGIPLIVIFVIQISFFMQEASPTTILIVLVGFIGSIFLTAAGVAVFAQFNREFGKVIETIRDRDGVTLETIGMEIEVPKERVYDHVQRGIAMKILRGRIVDDTYMTKLMAERIDSDTIRCPHCEAEMELPDASF